MYWVITVGGELFEMYEDYDKAFEAFDNYCKSYPHEKVEIMECFTTISYGGIELL